MLTKTTTLLRLATGLDGSHGPKLIFEQRWEDAGDSVREHAFFLDPKVWEELGSPETITVTVEAGDRLNDVETDQLLFDYELLPSMEAVRTAIKGCEGRHVQQAVFSTFMDALTQVCFTEEKIRSTIRWDGNRSWNGGR